MTRVLIVDDNPMDRRFAGACVEQSGMTATYAEHGREAMEQLSKETPDIVLTDLDMPGPVQGADLAELTRSLAPELPILFMSGNVNAAQLEAQLGWKRVSFLPKPANLRQLADATRQTLDRAS